MKPVLSFIIGIGALCIAPATLVPVIGQTTIPAPTPSVVAPAESPQPDVRSARERALLKLFEGQRHMWRAQRLRSQAGRISSFRLAQAAFENAVAIDPTLAEAFAALAELAVTLPPGNIEAAIDYARSAVKLNPQNWGGHRMLARFYTIKSRINNGKLIDEFADQATAAWREVARLDPRNAEAWAFIAAFAEAKGRVPEQIEALRRWVSSAAPSDVQFYVRVMKGSGLTPESAALKLAETLSTSGNDPEAISVLVALISDGGENAEAVSLLSQIVDTVDGESSATALTALQEAESANADNVQLTSMLARLYSRLGRNVDAIAAVDRRSASLTATDRRGASMLYVSLSDLYLENDRYDQAIAALERSLSVRGVHAGRTVSDDDREFAAFVFEKLIHLGKVSDRFAVAKKYVENAGKVLGGDDKFADRQMVALLQSFGERKEALKLVRSLRGFRPTDNGLLRSEATILSGLGQVDEAVALIKEKKALPEVAASALAAAATPAPGRAPASDDFSDRLFLSDLLLKAGRPKEAVSMANEALTAARGAERRQMARVALADAYRQSGDMVQAESLLRTVLGEMPRNPIALNSLGLVLAEKADGLDEAADSIRKALAIDQKNAKFLNNLGLVYFRKGQVSEAEKLFRRASRLDTDTSSIYENLGDVFNTKKETRSARNAWQRAVRLSYGQVESDRIRKKLGN